MNLVKLANNFHVVTIKDRDYWFSYETLIAFENIDGELYIIENQWNNTTGKHLNMINDDKSIRVSKTEFDRLKKAFNIE